MKKQIGFIGLGNMGLNMVYKLQEVGYDIHAWNRSESSRLVAIKAGVKAYPTLQELADSIDGENRIFWLMVSAGTAVDEVLSILKDILKKGDIIVEGANSFYKDSIRRHNEMAQLGVNYFDVGVSGGLEGARTGACIMVGGNKKLYETHIEPIVKAVSTNNGYGYFGEIGAGHFVKMVHNAIEYATMQAIGEGMNLVAKSEFKDVDLEKLADVWNHGSIIEGRLMGFMKEALRKDENLKSTKSVIGSLGTGEWCVREALNYEVPFTTIASSVFARYNSRGNDNFASKVVQALRVEFGGHNSFERPNN